MKFEKPQKRSVKVNITEKGFFIKNIYYYFKRCKYIYKLYYEIVIGKKFTEKLIAT